MLALLLATAPPALAGDEADQSDGDEIRDEFGDPVPPRPRAWTRPRGLGLGVTLLGEDGLRLNAGLANGGDLGVQATFGLGLTGAVAGASLLYDFPSETRWQFQLRGGLFADSAGGLLGVGAGAEYDPPSSFFLTLPVMVGVGRGGLTFLIAPSLGWVWDFDGK